MHYILIDYENVQPKNFTAAIEGDYKILFFVGAAQYQLPDRLIAAIQALGTKADYILIPEIGPNALDFHLTYYVGKLAAQDPTAHLHIISKDIGYDPLITYLSRKNVKIERTETLKDIAIKPAKQAVKKPAHVKMGTAQKINAIQHYLKTSRPRTEDKLSSFIKNTLQVSKDIEAQNLINCLRNKKIITGDKDKLCYQKLAS